MISIRQLVLTAIYASDYLLKMDYKTRLIKYRIVIGLYIYRAMTGWKVDVRAIHFSIKIENVNRNI